MKRLVLIVFLILTIGCSSYSTVRRSENENLINAPIDVVWRETLKILPTERMTLNYVNKDDYFISAKKSVTFWSMPFGNDVSIRLVPRGEKRTLVDMSSQLKRGAFDWGHEGRMVRNIFNRIKNASEGALRHKGP